VRPGFSTDHQVAAPISEERKSDTGIEDPAMPNGPRNPHLAQVIPIRSASLEVALPGFRPEGPIRCQSGQRPGGAENHNDPEEGENADVSKKSAMAWLERVYAVVFARHLFYQPLTATVVRQETDPIRSGRPGLRAAIPWSVAGGDCPDPFRSWVLNRFWPWRSVTKTLLKSCQMLPLCANPRSDSR
jgi:hypothetical protein